MYDLIQSIVGHNWTTGSSDQQYIYYCCLALIIIFAVVFIDMIRDIFSSFLRG